MQTLERGDPGVANDPRWLGVMSYFRNAGERYAPGYVERFHELKASDGFNSGEFVARHFLAIAFDPDSRTSEVALRLPDTSRRPVCSNCYYQHTCWMNA